MRFDKEFEANNMLSWARYYKVLLLAVTLLATSTLLLEPSLSSVSLSPNLFYMLYLLMSALIVVILFNTMKYCKELVRTNRELIEIQKEICKEVKFSLTKLGKGNNKELFLTLAEYQSTRRRYSNLISTRRSRQLNKWNKNSKWWRNSKNTKWKREKMLACRKRWFKNKPCKAQEEMENKEYEEFLEEEQQKPEKINGMSVNRHNHHHCKSNESSNVVIFSPTSQHDKEAVESTHSSKYRILCPIGHGSFGSVYLVEHKQTGCTFALKYIVCANDTRRNAALHEVETMNAVQGHPNIIKIIDMFMNYEFYTVSDVNSSNDKVKMNDAEHNNVSVPVHSLEQKEAELTSVENNNNKPEKRSAAHWAYLHLPVNQVNTLELDNSELKQQQQQQCQLEEKENLVIPALEPHNSIQKSNFNGNSTIRNNCDVNGNHELFMSSKLLSEADTECLMREAELLLRNKQNSTHHIQKVKNVDTSRPRKAEKIVSLLTHTSASHLKSEPQNNHTEILDDSSSISKNIKDRTHIKDNCKEKSDISEQNKEKLEGVEVQKEEEQVEETTNEQKECDNAVMNNSNSNNNSKSTSESNTERRLLKERTRNMKRNTKLRHGATIAPPPTSYAPRRVRYVDFTYPTFSHNTQNQSNNNNNTINIQSTNVNDYAMKDSIVNMVYRGQQLDEKQEIPENESKVMCTEYNNGKNELTNKLEDRAVTTTSNIEDVEEVMPSGVSNTFATPPQNSITYCNAHANVQPSQNIAITHYRNFATYKLSTRDSSSKSNQTTNFTSQSDEAGKQRKITSKRALKSPRMNSIHSNILQTNNQLHHTVQTTQISSVKVRDRNVITNNKVSTPSNKTTATNTTNTITFTNTNTNTNNINNVVSTGNSNVKRSKHTEEQLTLQHDNNDTNNKDESSSKLSSSVNQKHPGCLCLVMEYHPLGDLAHYVLRQRELMIQGHDTTEKKMKNPLTEPQLLSIAYQLSSVLQYLHSRNPVIIHRDLKPENILIKGDAIELLSSSEQIAVDASSLSLVSGRITQKIIPIVVTDFGLAITQEYSEEELELLEYGEKKDDFNSHHFRHSPRRTGKGGGTRPYISPESWLGQTSMASDMWSLGCVLYALATCRIASSNVRIMSVEAKKPDFANMILNDILQHNYSLMFGSFVLSLLVLDPSKRLSASAALRCFTVIKKSRSPKCHEVKEQSKDLEEEKEEEEEEVCFDVNSPFFSNVFDLEGDKDIFDDIIVHD